MGSLRFDGVRFSAYSDDHLPRHVHGSYAGVVVIVELFQDGTVGLSKRRRNILPPTAKKNAVKKVLLTAERQVTQLARLWEEIHGKKSAHDRR
ncbi:MAG TPA: hypothetical protein VF865_02430 [Acidobacteriaceae bacterium]